MKILYWIVGLIVFLGLLYWLIPTKTSMTDTSNTAQTSQVPVEVTPIAHATVVLGWAGSTLYVDPTGGASAFAGKPQPTITLVTDIHSDHFSTSTLEAVVASSTLIVPQAVKDQLPAPLASRARVLKNGESINEQGFSITAMPMYNLPGSGESFHTKGRGNGYIIERDGYRVYIAGDTQGTPEMRALTDIDMAFVPMNLPYTMSVEEAAGAVLAFKPARVYPYHYRGPDGLSDINKFKSLVNAADPSIDVVLLNWYPAGA